MKGRLPVGAGLAPAPQGDPLREGSPLHFEKIRFQDTQGECNDNFRKDKQLPELPHQSTEALCRVTERLNPDGLSTSVPA